jgi:hypothetical protein
MKSEGRQIDFVEQQRLAEAHRVAADAALHNPFFDERERQERAAYYRAQADKLEGRA